MNKIIALVGGIADILLFIYDELFGNQSLSSRLRVPYDGD